MLVQEGIIVVVVHHRLIPQGFLCLGNKHIPGNVGVKDVVLALRWVQDNIVAFKGNSANVVIAGQSFGAAMVEALMLSSMAKGLYHGAILQSGSVLSPWAFSYNAKERAISLGEMFNDKSDIDTVLLNAKIEDLLDKCNKLDIPYLPFGICVEKPLKNEELLLYEAPIDVLSNKQKHSVPLIIGYNSDEAYIFASRLMDSEIMKTISTDIRFLVPEELKLLNATELQQVLRQIEDMYFKNNRTMVAALAYHRDAYFVNHIYRSVRLHALASHRPVYFYQFSHNGDTGVQPEPGVKQTGAAHSDELAYLWGGRDLEGEDEIVQRNLIKLWTNFVKYLNPTQEESTHWDSVNADNPRLLDITTELKMMDFPHARAAHMWDNIYDKYYYTRNRVTGN